MRRRTRAVIVLTLVPTLVLSALWNWARDRSRSVPVATVPVAANVVDVSAEVATPLLSMRRQAVAVAAASGRDRRSVGLAEAIADLDDDECLSMTMDGAEVVHHQVDERIVAPEVAPLLIAAAALEVLGPDFVSTTRLVGAEPIGGRIPGDLYLIGGGDPFLGTEQLSGSRAESVTGREARLETLVRALVAGGITAIDGDIVGVDDRYPSIDRIPGGDPSAAALVVDGGRILTNPVNRGLDPAQTAARTLDELVRSAGISVSGTVRIGTAPVGAVELAAVDGAPLSDLVLSFGESDAAMWEIAPWNWSFEIARVEDEPSSVSEALAVVASVIGAWDVDAPELTPPNGPASARVSCRTLTESADRLSAAGALSELTVVDSSPLVAGLEIEGGSNLVIVNGLTASSVSVTAVGDRARIQRAIADVELLLADTSGEPQLEALVPVVEGAA